VRVQLVDDPRAEVARMSVSVSAPWNSAFRLEHFVGAKFYCLHALDDIN